MDALYFLRHSKFDDVEIRYSLRSVHQHLPFIRKVWVFGEGFDQGAAAAEFNTIPGEFETA